MKRRYVVTGFLVVFGAAAATFLICSIQAYREFGFICENTLSCKGHRQWILGIETGHWYYKSPLEQFIETDAAERLVHRWTSYAGTGKTLLGRPVLFSHGRPGAVMNLTHDVLRDWMERSDPDEIRRFYELLLSDDEEKIAERIDAMYEEVWEEDQRS